MRFASGEVSGGGRGEVEVYAGEVNHGIALVGRSMGRV